jgi:transposase
MRVAGPITLTDAERGTLERWSRGRTTPFRLVLRAKFILLASEGRTNKWIAAELRVDRQTVSRWRKRFIERGLAGIQQDGPRGRKMNGNESIARQIIQKTLHERPPCGGRWTTRALAAALGTSRSTVQRVWRAHGINPSAIGNAVAGCGTSDQPAERAKVTAQDGEAQQKWASA